ncbi:MAG: DUF1993 family protein [Pseudomonadota bacterium]
MYEQAVPPVQQALAQAQHLLAKATPEILSARLQPGMFDCAGQFQTVAIFALRATYPLTGKPTPPWPQGTLAEKLTTSATHVGALTPVDFAGAETRLITHRAGEADLEQTGTVYLHQFVLPNLWFHLSMAFAIMRLQGADIGKADFDGLHAYPAGFSF